MTNVKEFSEGENVTLSRLNEIVRAVNTPQINMDVYLSDNNIELSDGLRIEAKSVVVTPTAAMINNIPVDAGVNFAKPFDSIPIVVASWGDIWGIRKTDDNQAANNQRVWSAPVVFGVNEKGFWFTGPAFGQSRLNYIAIGL